VIRHSHLHFTAGFVAPIQAVQNSLHAEALFGRHGRRRIFANGFGERFNLLRMTADAVVLENDFRVGESASSEFFASPENVMDRNARHGVIGILMIGAGGFASMWGLGLLRFANRGRIARYQAGEMSPVVKDTMRDIAPAAGDVVRELAGAVRDGLAGGKTAARSSAQKLRHSCGALNDPDDRFCKGCGEPIAGRECPSCHASNDAHAVFCDRCGERLRERS
jgi:hypothetical protein